MLDIKECECSGESEESKMAMGRFRGQKNGIQDNLKRKPQGNKKKYVFSGFYLAIDGCKY